jgi:hypothetical protein
MVLGLFSKDRALRRAVEIATNVHRQSADRYAAMEKLKGDGSEQSLYGLCRRFSITADKTIEDQQEKQWVVDTLAARGQAALAPLRRFMKDAIALGYPLLVLTRIGDPPAVLEVIDELLAREEPGYTRDPKRKSDILEWLGEWAPATPEQVCRRAVPYLEDFDEGVRFKAVETIAQRPHPLAAEPLARALVRAEEQSKRLRRRIAEVVAGEGLSLGQYSEAVTPLLGDVLAGFTVQGEALVRT